MSDATTYDGPEYSPPGIVRLMGSILRIPRKWHETDFSYVFSTDNDLQHEYVDGLLVAGTVFFMMFCAWAFILIVLKIKGKEVGCASGRAFHTERFEEDMQSTDSSGSYFSDDEDAYSTKETTTDVENETTNKKIDDSHSTFEDEEECDESQASHDYSQDYDSQDGWLSTGGMQNRVNPRERRTRFCFLVFTLISLLCVPLILVFSFGPMKEAARASDDILLVVDDSVGQITASADTIDEVAASASQLANELPLDPVQICPLVKKENFEAELGINLNDLLDTVSVRFEDVDAYVTEILFIIQNVARRISDGAVGFEESVDKTEQLLWIVPGVLFAVSMLVSIAALGVLLAWKNKSGARLQFALSYGVLPLLIIVSAACWVLTIAAAFGTMTSSDFCTSGSPTGSPDATIQEILAMFDHGQNDTIHQLVNAYTNQCIGPDPVVEIDEIEIMVQDTIDLIWRQLSIVDKIGRAELIEQCGGGTSLADLFAGVRDLAKLLTTIRKSLGSASSSLECQRINPIYARLAHGSVCTDAASAAAYGFLFFLILGISTMVLISLRASWLKNVEEEKVYHDENEIAENMILDEHEEYLAYISRYKHEWQEYHGFEATSVVHSTAHSYRDDDDQSEGSMYFEDLSQEQSDNGSFEGSASVEGSEAGSDASSIDRNGPAGLNVEVFSVSFHTPSVHDGARACATDEISFHSLSAHKSEESVGVSIREEELFAGPSPLLPPAENPDFREDAPNEILVPSTEIEIVLKESRLKRMPSWSSARSTSGNSTRSSGSARSPAKHERIGSQSMRTSRSTNSAVKQERIGSQSLRTSRSTISAVKQERAGSNSIRTCRSTPPALKQEHVEDGGSFHERPDTPAAVAVARARTTTWTEGEESLRRRRTAGASPTKAALTTVENNQPRGRTSTWGGESTPVLQRASSSAELKTGNRLERRHSNASGQRVRRPSNSSSKGSKPLQSRNTEEQSELGDGLVEL